MIVTTTPNIEGKRIIRYCGVVAGEAILGANVFKDWRIQPVNATHALNISAGVWKPSVLRGLSFNCLAIALS